MVNTMVKDPENRKLNRKLDRQKKARMRFQRKALVNPLDTESEALAQIHSLKAAEIKNQRAELKAKKLQVEFAH